jgi:aspartyl aminopeptidase
LDNLIEFLRKYKTEESVASVIIKFEDLQSEFSKIEEKDADTLAVKDNTKRILSGGKNLIATAEQYKRIVDEIRLVRNSFTLTK